VAKTYWVIVLQDAATQAPLGYFRDHGEWVAASVDAQRFPERHLADAVYSVLQHHFLNIEVEQRS
jgi:hypothetical protein